VRPAAKPRFHAWKSPSAAPIEVPTVDKLSIPRAGRLQFRSVSFRPESRPTGVSIVPAARGGADFRQDAAQ